MNSIEAMKSEIAFQPRDISCIPLLRPRKTCLFVGAGDSYASGLAAQHASSHRSLCCNPLDLVRDPSIADGRVVYIVSISGQTKQNVQAAKVAAGRGLRTVAITAKADSPLALACDRVIQVRHRSVQVPTAGTGSFTSSLITCLSVASKITIPKRLDLILALAKRQARVAATRLRNVRGSFILLGDGILFPIALYGALKFHEVIGAKAIAYNTEEFCHSPIFSTRHTDGIIILGFKNDAFSKRLAKRLESEDYSFTTHTNLPKSEIMASLLHSTFFVQMLVLTLAEMRGAKECYFLRNKTLLRVSSDFIYG